MVKAIRSEKLRLIIVMEGGVIQNIMSDQPLRANETIIVEVIDHDEPKSSERQAWPIGAEYYPD